MTRRIMDAEPLAKWRTAEMYSENVRSDDDIRTILRNRSDTVYHPVGTTRMGADDGAVVDPYLRVVGVERLRVVDASIMPTLIGGNTNAPSIMIGEKGANMIRQGNWNQADLLIPSTSVTLAFASSTSAWLSTNAFCPTLIP